MKNGAKRAWLRLGHTARKVGGGAATVVAMLLAGWLLLFRGGPPQSLGAGVGARTSAAPAATDGAQRLDRPALARLACGRDARGAAVLRNVVAGPATVRWTVRCGSGREGVATTSLQGLVRWACAPGEARAAEAIACLRGGRPGDSGLVDAAEAGARVRAIFAAATARARNAATASAPPGG